MITCEACAKIEALVRQNAVDAANLLRAGHKIDAAACAIRDAALKQALDIVKENCQSGKRKGA